MKSTAYDESYTEQFQPQTRSSKPSLFDDLKPPLTETGAVVEASRCLECGGPYAPAPCTVGCPVGIDIPGFVSAIYRGEMMNAADIIFAENILGASCARVCPVEILCEAACVLEHEGRKPVEIGRLQRFAAEKALNNHNRISYRIPTRSTTSKVAVIGAGPAGLSCAAELAGEGYPVTVYDANEDFGGLVRYAIAPYRINRDPLPKEVQLIRDLGVDFKMGTAIDSPEKLQDIESEYDAIFLGIGLGRDVDLQYPGEELSGVWDSLDFIRMIKTGQKPKIGNSVGVIGGGNTAIDVAREALRLGAREVTMYYRRTEAEMPAYDHEIEEAREEGVRFQFLTNPVRFLGDEQLEAIELQYMKLGEPDASGRPRPEAVPGTEFTVRTDTVIKAIGQQKRKSFLSWIEKLELDQGLIKIDAQTGQTTNPKYFAGGDALNGGATVVEAVQDGKVAARGIAQFLGGES
ncbi:MAG: NAD(P)-dependent oxidoreductase [Balneolaceae bacterium]|nr:NAD(P)-dependent oxidoreductase [Balneolaceae bacterium]